MEDIREMSFLTQREEPTEQMREAAINVLCNKYYFARKISIGKSVLGRDLTGLKIGDMDDPVLFVGAFHPREWLTSLLLLRFAEILCASLDSGAQVRGIDCRKALLGRGIIIIPAINPDGVEIVLRGGSAALGLEEEIGRLCGGDFSVWNANARGVDLNHNYDAGWDILRQLEIADGIDGPSPRRFGGTAPESEPETQALVALCEKYSFRHVMAFHSQGEEIYWNYGSKTPERSREMADMLAKSSGYEVSEPTGIASHGGFKDWFIEKYARPGFTIEIGKGVNPLPIEMLDDITDRILEMMLLAITM